MSATHFVVSVFELSFRAALYNAVVDNSLWNGEAGLVVQIYRKYSFHSVVG